MIWQLTAVKAVGADMTEGDTQHFKTRVGPVVLGKIETGSVSIGDELFLVSRTKSKSVKVVAIEKFQKPNLPSASAGTDDVGIEISGVTFPEVNRGDILSSNAGYSR